MDNFTWLEEVDGKKAVEWVELKNSETDKWIDSHKDFSKINKDIQKILTDKDRLILPSLKEGMAYNFWTDEKNLKGVLRRTPIKEFSKKSPKWEVILDIDELSKKEKKDWVFKGSLSLYESERSLIVLSQGGTDKSEIREFDIEKKKFISNGFYIPEAKSTACWVNSDEILLGTDFKESNSLTTSGYPAVIKSLKRGQQLSEARIILQGEEDNVGIWAYNIEDESTSYNIIQKAVSFYDIDYYLYSNEEGLTKFPIPRSSDLKGVFKGLFLFELKQDWVILNKCFPCGSLISIPIEDLNSDDVISSIEIVILPDSKKSIGQVQTNENGCYITILNNVKSELYFCTYEDYGWVTHIIKTPENGSINYLETESKGSTVYFNFENFITPQTLYSLEGTEYKEVKKAHENFDTEGMKIYQFWATSEDGTEIPYFLVGKEKDIKKGNIPTLIYGYGGFQISLKPFYSAVMGRALLEKGGAFVLANIRGGNEFGPQWHSSTLKQNRHKRVQDFASVAKNLIDRGITSAKKIAIQGGSNGGLLMGSMYTKYPELLGAVICQVPLLDMLRYTFLPPGASWIAEYGDPEIPEMKTYLENNSPYHNLEEGKEHPPILFHTSSKDDRVHPGHARKMAALLDTFYKENMFYENRVGGHAGSSDHVQRAKVEAMIYCFLYDKIF